ncbi:hypothetical protein BaRGS_00020357 [Batillaria attramentaria]|uniref:Uncharacterized protein n=1 Tax=Batillaria attramentaria TaxID=370345 RepID=A0ABD0KNA8_9CAEN
MIFFPTVHQADQQAVTDPGAARALTGTDSGLRTDGVRVTTSPSPAASGQSVTGPTLSVAGADHEFTFSSESSWLHSVTEHFALSTRNVFSLTGTDRDRVGGGTHRLNFFPPTYTD